MKRIAILLLFVVALGFGGWWFWSLGRVEPVGNGGEIMLEVERPVVEVRRSGGEWEDGESGMRLSPSDEVRTGSGGRAAILFFGEAETTLRENTHIRIADAIHGTDAAPRLHTEVELLSGRVWSRVLQLFDMDSSFSVRTDTVVATVRGTAFDLAFEDGKTQVWVSESTVELLDRNARGEGVIVPEGWKMDRLSRGAWSGVSKMGEDDTSSDWFVRNTRANGVFRSKAIKEAGARLRQDGESAGRSRLAAWSERLHLQLADEKKPELYATFLGRRLYGIKSLIKGGKSGLAMQDFSRLEKEALAFVSGSDGDAYRNEIGKTLRHALIVLGDVEPRDPLFRLKQRVEDLVIALAPNDTLMNFMRLRTMQNRLKETVSLMRADALEEASLSLTGAEQGLRNMEAHVGEGKEMKLARQLRALVRHAEVLRAELDARVDEGVNASGVEGGAVEEPRIETPAVIQIISQTSTSTEVIAPEDQTTSRQP